MVYERYYRRMLGQARRYLAAEERAEDAVHNAFLHLIGHLERLRDLPEERLAACLALVCAVALGGVLTLSPAVRAEVAQWVRTWTGRMVSYHFGGTPAQEELPWYEIGDPLEGYVKREREWNGDQTHTSVYYYNRAGERIWFSYDRMREDFALGMRTEGVEMEIQQVTVNGCPGDLYLIKDGSKSNVVIWMDQDAGIVFLIDAWASKEELLHMAESVDLVQTPK